MAEFWHAKAGLNRAQRRRIEARADAVGRITEADRRFFARFPGRSHRLRVMSQPELEQLTAASGEDTALPPGERWFVLIRQVERGARMRRFARMQHDVDVDQPESLCAMLWDQLAASSDYSRRIEDALRAVVAEKGATYHDGADDAA